MFLPVSLLTSIFGGKLAEKFQKPISIAIYIIAALLLIVVLSWVFDDDTVEEQADQTIRSGQAITEAAENAIEKIGERNLTDEVIDEAVAQTQGEIENAKSGDDIRAAVISSLCGKPTHRNDPACRVQQPDP